MMEEERVIKLEAHDALAVAQEMRDPRNWTTQYQRLYAGDFADALVKLARRSLEDGKRDGADESWVELEVVGHSGPEQDVWQVYERAKTVLIHRDRRRFKPMPIGMPLITDMNLDQMN